MIHSFSNGVLFKNFAKTQCRKEKLVDFASITTNAQMWLVREMRRGALTPRAWLKTKVSVYKSETKEKRNFSVHRFIVCA